MSRKTSMKMVWLLLAVVLVAAGLFIAKYQYESSLRAELDAFLESLRPEHAIAYTTMETSLLDRSVTVSGVTGTSHKGKPGAREFSVDRIVLTGLNRDVFKPDAGTVRAVSRLEIFGSANKGEGYSDKVEAFVLTDISLDVGAFRRELAKVKPALSALTADADKPQTQAESGRIMNNALADLFRAYETLTVGKMTFQGYEVSVNHEGTKGGIHIGQGAVERVSLREIGPLSLSNLNLSVDGGATVLCGGFSWDGVVLPDYAALFQMMGAGNPSEQQWQNLLAGHPYSGNNLQVTDMRILEGGASGKKLIELKRKTVSYSLGKPYAMDLDFEGLVLEGVDFTRETLLEAYPDMESVVKLLPAAMSFSGAFSFAVTPKEDGLFDVQLKRTALKDANLGQLDLGFDVRDLNPLMASLGLPGAMRLGSFSLTAVDGAAFDVLFALFAKNEQGGPDALRVKTVALLMAFAGKMPDNAMKQLMNDSAAFVKNRGGTLKVAMTPETPLSLEMFEAAMKTNPDALGLSSSFAPGR